MNRALALVLVVMFAILALLWNGLPVSEAPVLAFIGPFLLFTVGAWLGMSYQKAPA